MKKAINIALLAVFVFIAELACTQTVATNGSGLFLTSNNSASAQNFIEASKTTQPNEVTENQSQTESKEDNNSQVSSFLSFNQEKTNYSVNDKVATLSVSNNEGSLPLFSGRVASSTPLQPIADSVGTTLSLFTSLLGIIVLALAVSWVIQKKSGFSSNDFGKVLGIVPLDNKRFIYIVDVMGKMMVLGVTENNISYLTEITDKDTIDAYRLKYGQAVTPGLDKLFPFLKKSEQDDTNNNQELTEKQSEILAKRKIKEVKNTLEDNHNKRLTRLNKMLISANKENKDK